MDMRRDDVFFSLWWLKRLLRRQPGCILDPETNPCIGNQTAPVSWRCGASPPVVAVVSLTELFRADNFGMPLGFPTLGNAHHPRTMA